MIGGLQLMVIVFSLFAWSRAFYRFNDHQIKTSAFTLWSLVWAMLILASLMPDASRLLSQALGIDRPVDVFIYSSIIVLLYLVFRLYIKLESANYETTRVVRAIALDQVRKYK